MKLSDYAQKTGIGYRTAWRWFKMGQIARVSKLEKVVPNAFADGIEDFVVRPLGFPPING